VTLNIDWVHNDAYFSLLSSAYVYILKTPAKGSDPKVRKEVANRILDTLHVLYCSLMGPFFTMVDSWVGDCSKASVWGAGYKD